MSKPNRAAVIGVSHWHSTYDAQYLDTLRRLEVPIVGVSDENAAIAQDRAARFGTTAFADYKAMIEATKPDFIVALGRHIDMPDIFRHLVATGIPFVMEKPWGVDAETVRGLADLAEAKGAWVAAPFMTRYSHWAEAAREAVQGQALGAVSHIVFRMIRPSMVRYQEWDSPWMLSKAQAGGGALLNLGSHGFDICRFITGEEPEVISAVLSNKVHDSEVEDYAHVVLRTPSGIIFHNEVGYTMPTWPKNSTDGERKVAAAKGILRGVATGVHILGPDRDETIATAPDYVGGYTRVFQECFAALAKGEPPPITARDCANAVSLIHEAYRIARQA